MSSKDSKDFAINLFSTISVDVDLSKLYARFFIWLLIDEKDGLINFANSIDTIYAIEDVGEILKKSLTEILSSEEILLVKEDITYAIDEISKDAEQDASFYEVALRNDDGRYEGSIADASENSDTYYNFHNALLNLADNAIGCICGTPNANFSAIEYADEAAFYINAPINYSTQYRTKMTSKIFELLSSV